jgi:DNA-binding NarL/FixJ family response regulator
MGVLNSTDPGIEWHDQPAGNAVPVGHLMDLHSSSDAVTKTRVLVVDDHDAVRRGLTQLLEQQPDLTVCAAVEDAERALLVVQQQPVDLAIVDICLGRMDGRELTQRLSLEYPHLRIVVFSMHDALPYADRALRAGASGFVAKQEAYDTLLVAIRQILAGQTYVSKTQGLSA